MARLFPPPVIVIGMHRSGTSMLSHALHLSGINMGVFQDHNHEAINFIHLNERMLECAGASWKDPVVPGDNCLPKISPVDIYLDHLKLEGASPWKLRLFHQFQWGWKDPRNTFTLPLWLQLFPDAKVIHIVRNGLDVARSLARRDKVLWEVPAPEALDIRWGFRLWEKYVDQATSSLDMGIPILEVRYEDILRGDTITLKKIDAHLGKKVSSTLKDIGRKTTPNAIEIPEWVRTSKWMNRWGYL